MQRVPHLGPLLTTALFAWVASAAAQPPGQPAPVDPGRPFLTLERGEVQVAWRRIREGGPMTLTATLDRPSLRVVNATDQPAPERQLPSTGRMLRRASPVPLDLPHVEIHQGELLYLDQTRSPAGRIALHDLEVSLDNMSTSQVWADGRPALLTASGRLGRSGEVTVFVTADPWSENLDLAGRAQVLNLDLRDVNNLLPSPAKATRGTADLFVEFVVQEGRITGGVKAVVEDLEIESESDTFIAEIGDWLLDAAVVLFSDKVPGRHAVATVVPLSGQVRKPDVGVLGAVFGILRNAFVKALQLGFQQVPPGRAAMPADGADEAYASLDGDAAATEEAHARLDEDEPGEAPP